MYTNWGSVAPFVLTSGSQFRPAAHPAVDGAAYASALAEVENLGRDSSTTRTADQTVAGKFWSASPIWNTWNQVAQQLVGDDTRASPTRRARSRPWTSRWPTRRSGCTTRSTPITCWRPVTAIRAGVPGLAGDPNWNPLTPTAADPSYPGAHSALSAAAATALGAVWGDRQSGRRHLGGRPRRDPQLHQPRPPSPTRRALSRIWAGQHTRIDDEAGRQLGRQVAGAVLGALQVAPRLVTGAARPRRRPGVGDAVAA